MGKKGGAVTEALWTGMAFYAANTSSTFSGFLLKFLKYGAILAVIGLVLYFVFSFVIQLQASQTEKFVPQPSEKGDQKYVTAKGNVILY